MFTVKHRCSPKVAVVLAYNVASGRKGKVLASEPLPTSYSNADLQAAARRLVSLVPTHAVILPVGSEL